MGVSLGLFSSFFGGELIDKILTAALVAAVSTLVPMVIKLILSIITKSKGPLV